MKRQSSPSRLLETSKTLALAISVTSASLVACSPALPQNTTKEADTPIKIGVLSSLTGVGSAAGKDLVNGLNLWADEVHHEIGKRKFEIVVEDDAGDPTTGIAKLDSLINKSKVNVVDGIVLSNIAYAIAPHIDKSQIPVVLAIAGADDLTKNKRHEWLVRSGYSASQLTMPFGEYAFKTLGYKRIATIGQNFPFCWESIGGFHKTFEDAGGQIVQKVWTPLEVTDFTEYIKQLRNDVDAVFVCTTINPAMKFLPQFRSLKGKMTLIGSGVNFDEAVIKAVGKDALGGISCQNYAFTSTNAANKQFLNAYKAKYHTNASWAAEGGYTSGLVIEHAVKSINGDVENKEKFLNALKKVEISTAPRGPLKLDEYGNPIENIYIRRVEEVGGTPENSILHTYNNVSQFWKYNPGDYLKQPEYRRAYPPCKHCTESDSESHSSK